MKKIKIPIDKAIGLTLEHDITKIDESNNFKGALFKKGHVIRENDIPIFKSLGKNYIYRFYPHKDDIHENDFAVSIAPHVAGKNVYFSKFPEEGKISFYSFIQGLLKVDKTRLFKINALKELSLPVINDNFPVNKGKLIATFRIIPLFAKSRLLNRAIEILNNPILHVNPYIIRHANLIITGNEIYDGIVKDRFEIYIKSKLKKFDVCVDVVRIVPDSVNAIRSAFINLADTQLIIITGGSSIDPDDVTKKALKKCGVRFIREGNPIQPANNFTMGRFKDINVCIVPAGSLHYKTSAFDVFLPRILAEDKITNREIVQYALGGLCHFCEHCTYPICPFGRS